MRVQRNATSALLNMTHSGSLNIPDTHLEPVKTTNVPFFPDESRQQLVNAGAIPVLVCLLNSPDTDVQHSCTTALSDIAVDAMVSLPYLVFGGSLLLKLILILFRFKPRQTGTK
jgi:vacuolar protein 8